MATQTILNFLQNHNGEVKVYSGLFLGTLLQVIYSQKVKNIKFVLVTFISSMFLYCYIIEPITKHYFGIGNEHLLIFLASISGLLSVIGITVIIEWLPSQLKEKLRNTMGLHENKMEKDTYYDDIDKG